jgi:hypothetical protein
MCDYSLGSVASRPAKVGDKLVTSAFANSFTRGFAAVGEADIAVCLKPGTEIAFEKEAEYRHPFARLIPGLRFGKLDGRVARFRKVNPLETAAHHDALEFADGRTVLLNLLRLDQHATVLQTPAEGLLVKERLRRQGSVWA